MTDLAPEVELTHAAPDAGRASLRSVKLVRSFGDGDSRRVALSEVSFDLHPGKLALLMGPSGSGKSTLLAILSGLLPPDSGQVIAWENGKPVDVWALRQADREAFRLRQVGFIFQGYNLFPALTASQQLEIVLKWGQGLSTAAARKRSHAMLDSLGMGRLADKKPAHLSGGEKQRVAIGRALVKGSSLIFADEPTSALDWENGKLVLELLRREAHEHAATIFVVSHDHRMLPYTDVAYHLEDGHLTELARSTPGVSL
jgi:putative ABC transport system ATP-binding protein